MHLRRRSERAEHAPTIDTAAAWDGIPDAPSGPVVIKAPKAGDLVAEPSVPLRAA